MEPASSPAVLLPASACGALPHNEGAVKVFLGANGLAGSQGLRLGVAMVRKLVPPECKDGRQTDRRLSTRTALHSGSR
jgi:hypothetical protein